MKQTLYGVQCPDIHTFCLYGWADVHYCCGLMCPSAVPIHERIPSKISYCCVVMTSAFIRWLARALTGGQK